MAALDDVVTALRCPVCTDTVRVDGRRLCCGNGHSFDLARHGYVNLLTGRGGPGTGDTAAMVDARARFLAAGHYAPIADRVAAAATGPVVLDLAGGTGYYLARALDRLPTAAGLSLDLSAPALRRAARAHPRAAAIGADAWAPLPVATGAVGTVLSVFGPRDPGEIERVLAPDGRLVVASALPEHLHELVVRLGLVGVDPHKARRQAAAFAAFDHLGTEEVRYRLTLEHAGVEAVVGMGPSASHVGPADLAGRVAALPALVEVQVAVRVSHYSSRPLRLPIPSPGQA